VNCFGFFLTLRFSAAPLFFVCYHSSQWYIYIYKRGLLFYLGRPLWTTLSQRLIAIVLVNLSFFFWKKEFSMIRQLLTVDLLARASMKNAANCDT